MPPKMSESHSCSRFMHTLRCSFCLPFISMQAIFVWQNNPWWYARGVASYFHASFTPFDCHIWFFPNENQIKCHRIIYNGKLNPPYVFVQWNVSKCWFVLVCEIVGMPFVVRWNVIKRSCHHLTVRIVVSICSNGVAFNKYSNTLFIRKWYQFAFTIDWVWLGSWLVRV